MVEGPKVLIKSEALQKLVGQVLQTFSSHISTREFEHLFQLQVIDVSAVGKELFIVFANGCLRLHFGMNGTERILKSSSSADIFLPLLNNASSTSIPRDVVDNYKAFKSYKSISFVIFFDQHYVAFYDTVITSKSLNYLETCRRTLLFDVLSSDFQADKVIERIMSENPNRIIMDSIMDQNILPGVGNIIKCEGLFLAHIHPNQPSNSIGKVRLEHLIHGLKTVAQEWYQCTKFKSRIFLKNVYLKSVCVVCSSIIRLVRDGKLKRITYYCNTCQPLLTTSIPNVNASVVSSSSSSSSSAAAGTIVVVKPCFNIHESNLTEDKENLAPSSSSSSLSSLVVGGRVCSAVTAPVKLLCLSSSSSLLSQPILRARNKAFVIDLSSDDDDKDDEVTGAVTAKRTLPPTTNGDEVGYDTEGKQSNAVLTHPLLNNLNNFPDTAISTAVGNTIAEATITSSSTATATVTSTATSTACDSSHTTVHTNTTAPPTVYLYYFHQPLCQCRDKHPATLQRVRKDGPTNNRMFWCCHKSSSKKGRCSFFHWADQLFPRCKCTINKCSVPVQHQSYPHSHSPAQSQAQAPVNDKQNYEICILRRVLKPGANNGRFFFCCKGGSSSSSDSGSGNRSRSSIESNNNNKCDFFVWADIYNSFLKNQREQQQQQSHQSLSISVNIRDTNSSSSSSGSSNSSSIDNSVHGDTKRLRIEDTAQRFVVPL